MRTSVLLSGTGRTLENLIHEQAAGRLPVEFVQVLSSKPGVRGLDIAAAAGIPQRVLRRQEYADAAEYGAAISQQLIKAKSELVLMAGFLHLWHIDDALTDKVLNIHPSLLPAFGGRGFHGQHVHQAVYDAGVKITGCTVHFANNVYDDGAIILQRTTHVHSDDTPADIAAKVFEEECLAYPEAVRWFVAGRLVRHGKRVEIIDIVNHQSQRAP